MHALKELEVDEDVSNKIRAIHASVIKNGVTDDKLNSDELKTMLGRLNSMMSQAANRSRTAKLWVQYYDQIHRFVRAERTGDWSLQHWYSSGDVTALSCSWTFSICDIYRI